MSRPSGLGRGLGALIPAEPTEMQGEGLRDIAVSDIAPNPHQPREQFDEDALVGLAESIRELGVLQPVLVRMLDGGRYELIAGERRWRASQRAGLTTIPAIIRSIDDRTSLEHAVVENLHRQDLNALEEAAAYQQLIEDFSFTQEQVATRVGKSRSAVANLLRLFQLPAKIQAMVADDRLSAGHARALLGTKDRAFQEHLASRAVAESLSVREVEDAVRTREELAGQLRGDSPDAGDNSPAPVSKDGANDDAAAGGVVSSAAVLELENLLADRLDTRVGIEVGKRKGRMTIDFADVEDLERIFRLITS